MFIKSALTVFYLATLAVAQATETDGYVVPDFGLTPSQTTAIELAEMSLISSIQDNPTFTSIVAAYATASSNLFDQLLSDVEGGDSSLPTGTAARAAIKSDIDALPTSGGVRDFFAAIETQVYSEIDGILGVTATGSATARSTGSAVSASGTETSSVVAGATGAAAGNGVKGAFGGVAILGAVMAML